MRQETSWIYNWSSLRKRKCSHIGHSRVGSLVPCPSPVWGNASPSASLNTVQTELPKVIIKHHKHRLCFVNPRVSGPESSWTSHGASLSVMLSTHPIWWTLSTSQSHCWLGQWGTHCSYHRGPSRKHRHFWHQPSILGWLSQHLSGLLRFPLFHRKALGSQTSPKLCDPGMYIWCYQDSIICTKLF